MPNMTNFRSIVFSIALMILSSTCMADAIIRSQAMFANTIAEYYVERDHVRLELEGDQANPVIRSIVQKAAREPMV
jgi:uncharacterized membrane protein